ncbi:hypothetical protein KY284_033203 [Solanum tuberosum]|nr:hypothetical protein KY284_033203 [Solanum tuberosum]
MEEISAHSTLCKEQTGFHHWSTSFTSPNITRFAALEQDENQKETYMSPIIPTDSSSFMVNNNINQNKNGKQFQKFNPGASGSGSGTKPNMGYPRMNNYQQGHVIDDCYRLIGFPEDFNFTNDKTYSTLVRGNGAIMEEEDPNYYMD